MVDATLQRKNMVESQVRPSDVTDRRITAAMIAVPREKLVPPQWASLAYMDDALDFGDGRFMMAPRSLARLVQLGEIDAADRVLVIGGHCGYAAAIVANLARSVVALLPNEKDAAEARQSLDAIGISNVEVEAGELSAGSAASAPFDVIVIEGGVEIIPDRLRLQLKPSGGRLVAVEHAKLLSHAMILRNFSAIFDRRLAFELGAPLLAGFQAQPSEFVF